VFQPSQIGDFAAAQLEEANNYLVTGSEERYSNLELEDLKGNLGSAVEAVTVLSPALSSDDPSLLRRLDATMKTATSALARLAQSPGSADTGYESYTEVPLSEREVLAQDMLNMASPMSEATQLVA
jgi:iron uptake system EfeUOB component EfeO/EfeM